MLRLFHSAPTNPVPPPLPRTLFLRAGQSILQDSGRVRNHIHTQLACSSAALRPHRRRGMPGHRVQRQRIDPHTQCVGHLGVFDARATAAARLTEGRRSRHTLLNRCTASVWGRCSLCRQGHIQQPRQAVHRRVHLHNLAGLDGCGAACCPSEMAELEPAAPCTGIHAWWFSRRSCCQPSPALPCHPASKQARLTDVGCLLPAAAV